MAKPPTEESRRFYEETVAKFRDLIAEMRQKADRLVAEDGSAEARRKAKSIRISATHGERQIRQMCEWAKAEDAKAVAS